MVHVANLWVELPLDRVAEVERQGRDLVELRRPEVRGLRQRGETALATALEGEVEATTSRAGMVAPVGHNYRGAADASGCHHRSRMCAAVSHDARADMAGHALPNISINEHMRWIV